MEWSESFPQVAVLQDPALADAGVRWLSEAESAELSTALTEQYAEGNYASGVWWTLNLHNGSRDAVRDLRAVAMGPRYPKRSLGDRESVFFVHPERPDSVVFAPCLAFPALLWVTVPATIEGVLGLLAEFPPRGKIERLALPRIERAYMGEASQLPVSDPYNDLDRHWMFSPAIDEYEWGSAFNDDPWAHEIEPAGGLQLLAIPVAIRQHRAQQRGVVPRLTRRTLYSHSQLTYEKHRGDHYVWEVRYRPSRYAEVIERFNAAAGLNAPLDLPIDVACAVHGFEFFRPERIEERMRGTDDPTERRSLLRVLAAVRHVDVGITNLLREYLHDPDEWVRGTVYNAAADYGWEFLVEDLAAVLPPGNLADHCDRVLDEGIPTPSHDEVEASDDESDDETDDESDGDEDSDEAEAE